MGASHYTAVSCHFISNLRPKYSPRRPDLKCPQTLFLLKNVTYQVSHSMQHLEYASLLRWELLTH
jgi:hypothetical protein